MNKNLSLSTKQFNASTDLNRRSDDSVRNAIDRIQTLLFDPDASEKIFPIMLKSTIAITNSDYGVILTADKMGVRPIEKESNQKLCCITVDDDRVFICPDTAMHWIKNNVMPMRPVFFNHPISKSHRSLLINSEQVRSLIILPIVSQNQLRGICIMGKTKSDYSSEMARRLMPLFGSVICTLQSAESVKGNICSLDQKISDNRFLSTLLSTSPIAILVVDQSKKIVVSNQKAIDMFSDTTIDKKNNHLLALDTQAIDTFIPNFDDLFKWSNQPSRYGEENQTSFIYPKIWEDQVAHKNDNSQFLVNISVFRYTHGTQRFTTLQIQDITAMRANAEEFQLATQQLNALTHLVPVGIIRVDVNWQCVYANDKWYEFTGLTQQEAQHSQWINAIHSDDVKQVLEELREALQVGSAFKAEIRLVSPLGQIRWVELNTQVLFDDEGSIQGFLATFADITERLLHQERLRHVAEYDSLTGLANRNLFQDRLQQAFYASKQNDSEVVVFFLDLDGFKDVNDTLGHDTGDQLLQQVADRLLNTLQPNDTVARFGGDEFVILLTCEFGEAIAVAAEVIEVIAKPYIINGQDIFITVSLGIARGRHDNSSLEQILKQADAALYLAKEEGKNNFQLFNDALDKKAKNRISLANELRLALQEERYFLLYQPQADIKNKAIIGYEALLRFTNSQGQVMSPDKFIPILENSGMIIRVGQWILEEACQQLKRWQNQDAFPADGLLSFNVSPKQLLDDSFVSSIINTCNKFQVNPERLVIEITETVLIDKPEKVAKAMEELKNIGVKLALDDFGTGYSSLTYLQRYPFDHIKIDKSFIADLSTDENNAKITQSIIALAKSLGLKITAEGVSEPAALSMLEYYGANYFQGYLLGKPQSPAEATANFTIDQKKPDVLII